MRKMKKMKNVKNVKTKMMALLMAAVLLIGMSAPASVLAEGEEETTTVTKTEATIDSSKTGSLTLYKYDHSAYEASLSEGEEETTYTSTGEANTDAESQYGSYAIVGVEFTALKVANIATYTYTKTDDNSVGVEVVYSLDSKLATEILGLKTDDAVVISETNYWTSTQISEALSTKLSSDTDSNVTTTIDALKNYITTSQNDAVAKTTDTDGKATWTSLELGLYLVVETAVPDQVNTTTDPFFVSIPMTTSDGKNWLYDVTAYPKNQTDYPDITKKVRENTDENTNTYTDTVSSSIGDKLDYRIVSKLPSITSEATYLTQYTFTDTLSKGQTYNDDIVVTFYETISDSARIAASLGTASATLTAVDDYTVDSSTDTESGVTTITITLTAAGLKKVNEGAAAHTNTNGDYSYIVISYTATLNANAVLGDSGNENDVKLTYGRTNESYTEQLEDKTEVYTFGLDITKVLSGDTDDVTSVQFTLRNSDGKYITATKNSAGNYTVKGLADTSDNSNDTVFSPASDGSLYIAGIEAGTYTLTEIKTASGYTLLKDEITIVITTKAETITASTVDYIADNNGNTVTTATQVIETETTENSSATVNGESATMSSYGTVSASKNAAVVMEITNTKGFTLPTTGGAGIWLIVILGVVIGGLGIYSFVSKRREEN